MPLGRFQHQFALQLVRKKDDPPAGAVGDADEVVIDDALAGVDVDDDDGVAGLPAWVDEEPRGEDPDDAPDAEPVEPTFTKAQVEEAKREAAELAKAEALKTAVPAPEVKKDAPRDFDEEIRAVQALREATEDRREYDALTDQILDLKIEKSDAAKSKVLDQRLAEQGVETLRTQVPSNIERLISQHLSKDLPPETVEHIRLKLVDLGKNNPAMLANPLPSMIEDMRLIARGHAAEIADKGGPKKGTPRASGGGVSRSGGGKSTNPYGSDFWGLEDGSVENAIKAEAAKSRRN